MISRRRFLQLSALSLVPLTLGLPSCSSKDIQGGFPVGTSVTALGDSLTFGYSVDAKKQEDYPSQLAKLTGWEIKNSGVNGDTSQDVLNRLDDIISAKPKLVLLSIGGNDVLQRIPTETTKANIISIIQKLKSAKISVLLIAQPYFSASALLGRLNDNPIFKKIANETGTLLYADGWSKILSDRSLKSDQIHANALGYQKFAKGLFTYLQKIGYTDWLVQN